MRTDDGGRTWTNHTDGLEDQDIKGLCVNNTLLDDTGRLTLAAMTIADRPGLYVFHSGDDGVTWESVCRMDEVACYAKFQDCREREDDIRGWRSLGIELSKEQRHPLERFLEGIESQMLKEAAHRVPPELLDPPGAIYRADLSWKLWQRQETMAYKVSSIRAQMTVYNSSYSKWRNNDD